MAKILIYSPIHVCCSPYNDIPLYELVVRARQLASVSQLVRALHRNHWAAGLIPARGHRVAFFATASG